MILKAIGVVAVFYILYVIVMGVFTYRKMKKIERIEKKTKGIDEKLSAIDKKLNKLLKKKKG